MSKNMFQPGAAKTTCHRLTLRVTGLYLLLALLWAYPVLATDNYHYRPGEYVTVSRGRSPDGRWSIAAHGGGPYGYDDFDLYLIREPAHRKVAALREGGNLDTGPISIVARWARDSRHVLILHRIDRHVLDLQLFAVAKGQVHSIEVPTLASVVGGSRLQRGAEESLFGRYYRIAWQNANRFTLQEFDGYDARGLVFRPGVEAYLTIKRLAPQRIFTSFSASALAEITSAEKLRLSAVGPLRDRGETIIYSPHLLYDRWNGLHATETTMSSLAAQESREHRQEKASH